MTTDYTDRAPDGRYLREPVEPLSCRGCGGPLVPDWVGDPDVGWCSPCGEWQFPEERE